MIGWLRDYIAKYAITARSLQDRKTTTPTNSLQSLQKSTQPCFPTHIRTRSLGPKLQLPKDNRNHHQPTLLFSTSIRGQSYRNWRHDLPYQGILNRPRPQTLPSITAPIHISRLPKDTESKFQPTETEIAGIVRGVPEKQALPESVHTFKDTFINFQSDLSRHPIIPPDPVPQVTN